MRRTCTTSFVLMSVVCCSYLLHVLSEEGIEKYPKPPYFDASYEVEYNFTLPYMQRIQKDGLTYSVHVWRDAEKNRVRMDTYGGVNLEITTSEVQYQVSPQINSLVCAVYKSEGPAYEDVLGSKVIPDISGWEFTGTAIVHGQKALEWTFEHWNQEKHLIYRFYTSPEGQPLQWHMHGQDGISGAHFDEWIVDYVSYTAGAPNSDVFNKPSTCEGVEEQQQTTHNGFTLRMASLCPVFRFSRDTEYDAFSSQHQRAHGSPMEYEIRKSVYYSNKQLIQDWNAGNESFTMAVNKFADWSEEEFEAVMLPNRARRAERAAARNSMKRKYAVPFKSQVPRGMLPRGVDWSGTGTEGPVAVKDQATCGSCWAFGAVGAITSQYYMMTGNAVDFSQQQLVDCSWDYGNNGCNGGDYDQAFEYLVENGGIAENNDYEYLGQDGFCRANTTRTAAYLKGYVLLPEGDNESLMEALYRNGPVAIALDAGHPSFRFYNSGVYYEPRCVWKYDELDHAVMAVGYGSTEGGQDYWIVRNSWSTYWGDNGYIRVSRRGHACGITTQAAYPIIVPHPPVQTDTNDA